MAIDPNQPVRVKKTIVTEGANVYPARENPYLPGEIPKQYLISEFCTQKGVQFRQLPDALQTINQTQSDQATISLKPGELVVTDAVPKLNINFASPAKIADFIDGLGPKTVEKLDACRQEEPFKSIEDLEARCPMPKASGKSWDTYKDAIEF